MYAHQSATKINKYCNFARSTAQRRVEIIFSYYIIIRQLRARAAVWAGWNELKRQRKHDRRSILQGFDKQL